MDNETSELVEDFIKEQNAEVQHAAPESHCAPAEKAVQTYKSCFKSVIASVPKEFPMGLWCRLLEQTDLGVNIVRPYRQNPRLSAWAAMEGEYHFHATPIAPPGSKMLMYQKPGSRRTWGQNYEWAWYIGPALTHYRTFRGVLPKTQSERLTDSAKFKHHVFDIPELTPADRIIESARDLRDAICQQEKQGPLDVRKAIETIQEVMLGKM